MDDETVKEMVDKAGYVEGLRPQWHESMEAIQKVINLHNQTCCVTVGLLAKYIKKFL